MVDMLKDESYVIDLCEAVLGEPASRQHRFDWLLGDLSERTGRRVALPVDAYWPGIELVVEFRESQHYEPTPHFDKPNVLTVSGVHRGLQRKLYDDRREQLIPVHGIRLVIMKTTDFAARGKRIVRDETVDREIVRGLLA
jgi:hypothetical protein